MEQSTSRDFMDVVDDNWDALIEKLKGSSFHQDQEIAMNQLDQDMEDLKRENMSLRQRLAYAEGRLTRTEKKLEEANEKILDLTSRSMRDNLIFKNIEETRGETEADIERKLSSVFKDKLKLNENELSGIQIERAHRMGKPGKQGDRRPRNIIAKLSSKGKGKVMSHLKNLSRSDSIRIQEQYPPEIHARRNKLWPQFIQSKQSGKPAKFSGDKLIVENKVLNPPRDRVNDINLDVTTRAMEMKPKHTPVMTMDRSHFQGHIVPIKSTDDVIPALQALCHDQRVAGSTHIVYAYRIGNDKYNISNFEDDGEWGAGRQVMGVLDNRQCYNHLVAVTRWYGGQHLGPSRFQHIQQMANQAVSFVSSGSA